MSAQVIEYYNQCHVDYEILWRSHQNLCIHFGYFDDQHDSHAKALPNMNRVLAKRAAITNGETVLDAGCGVGGSSIWLAEQLGAKVCGINIQPLHLQIARREATERGVDHLVRFVEKNYCDTGEPEETFDVVWALESVCHCTDKMAFIKEAHRVLKPGGRLMVADFFQFKRDLNDAESDCMRMWLDGWALPHLAGVSEFGEAITQAGFQNVECDDITANVIRSSRRIWKASLIILPLSKPLELVGLRSKRQTANVLAARHQYTTICDGLWGYSVFTARKPCSETPSGPTDSKAIPQTLGS